MIQIEFKERKDVQERFKELIETDMPLYQDMLEIRKRSRENNLKFYSHEEVWSD